MLPLDATGGLPLGIVQDQADDEASNTLNHGDLLPLYTDGITEAAHPSQDGGILFGGDRLDTLLVASLGSSSEETIARIPAKLAAFCGTVPTVDDQRFVAIRCL